MILKKFLAEVLLVVHGGVVLFILFGWLVPGWWKLYLGVLVLTATSYVFFRNCILSTWEFNLRRQANPDIRYDATWLSYYAPWPFRLLPNIFWSISTTGFVFSALALTVYIHLL